MSFTIKFDYRFDSTGFLTPPLAADVMEAAARVWEEIIEDEFDDIPVGAAFTVFDPSTALPVEHRITLTDPIDDIVIFVGAQSNLDALAYGGPDGTDLVGDIYQSRVSGDFRNTGTVTDFEPWAGGITFSADTNWHAGPGLPPLRTYDLLTVAVHEIGHVLGIGTSFTFDALIVQGRPPTFAGVNATAQNRDRAIPLDPGLGHVEEGFAGNTVALDPFVSISQRTLPSVFDKAILADIGYEIAGFMTQGRTPVLVSNGDDSFSGTQANDIIDTAAGNDQIFGNNGDDRLFGNAGHDSLYGDAGSDTLFGGSADDVLSGGAGFDRLSGGIGNDSLNGGQGNDNLVGGAGDDILRGEEDADQLRGGSGHDTLWGGSGDDGLEGGAGNDLLQGEAGNDTLRGGAGDDTLTGGPGDDVFVVTLGDGWDRIEDFEADKDRLHLIDSGFADLTDALAAIVAVEPNLARLTLNDGTTLDFHHSGASTFAPSRARTWS